MKNHWPCWQVAKSTFPAKWQNSHVLTTGKIVLADKLQIELADNWKNLRCWQKANYESKLWQKWQTNNVNWQPSWQTCLTSCEGQTWVKAKLKSEVLTFFLILSIPPSYPSYPSNPHKTYPSPFPLISCPYSSLPSPSIPFLPPRPSGVSWERPAGAV